MYTYMYIDRNIYLGLTLTLTPCLESAWSHRCVYRVNPIYIYVYIYIYIYNRSLRWRQGRVKPFMCGGRGTRPQLGLYTILPLPILYGV